MQIIFFVISIAWVFCAYKLLQQKILAREQGLMVNFLLLTIAWAGLNTLLGLIQLFDFIESIDQDLIAGFTRDKVSLGWIMFCFTNGLLNMIFVALLMLSRIKQAGGITKHTLINS